MENSTDNSKELSRYERKRLGREKEERGRRKTQTRKKIRNYSIGAVALFAVAGGVYAFIRAAEKNTASLPGEQLPSKGQQHVATTDLKDYNSTPPTSGQHYSSQTNWGIHKEPIPEGYQLHNLEHGGVLIQYKPGLAADIVEKLKAVGEGYKWKKLILAPYPPLDKNIALTAWTRLDTFDDFDEARVKSFIDSFRNRGPENVPDNMQSTTLP
jgi:hypothetical protein